MRKCCHHGQCNDKKNQSHHLFRHIKQITQAAPPQVGWLYHVFFWCSDWPKSPLTLAFKPGGPADVYGNATAAHFWHKVFICASSMVLPSPPPIHQQHASKRIWIDRTKNSNLFFYGKSKRSFLSFIHDDLWKELVKSQHCRCLKCCFHACFSQCAKERGLAEALNKIGFFFHPGFTVWRRAIRAD